MKRVIFWFLTTSILLSLVSCAGKKLPQGSGETDGAATSQTDLKTENDSSAAKEPANVETPAATISPETVLETAAPGENLPSGPDQTDSREEHAAVVLFTTAASGFAWCTTRAELIRSADEWQQCPLKTEPPLADYADGDFFNANGLVVFQTYLQVKDAEHALVSCEREGTVLQMTVEIRADMSQKYEFGHSYYSVALEKPLSELEGITEVRPEVRILLDGKQEDEYWRALQGEDLGKFGDAAVIPEACHVIPECRVGEDPALRKTGGLIRSAAEWQTLIEPYRGLSLYKYYGELAEKCDQDFFAKYALAALQITASSGGFKQIVRRVYPESGNLVIVCEQRYTSGTNLDAAVGSWTVFVPIPLEVLGTIEQTKLSVIRTIDGIPCQGLH